jgi:hypothetical protein
MITSGRAPAASHPGMETGHVVRPRAILLETWWLNRTLMTVEAEPAALMP